MINVKERMNELRVEWCEAHPNATEQEIESAFDEIAGKVIHEIMGK